jgi:predicted ATPase
MLLAGDFAAAERAIAMLAEAATKLNAAFWQVAATCLKGKLLVKRGSFAAGVALLREGLAVRESTGWNIFHPEFLGALAEGLAGAGQHAEALATIERALAEAGYDGERYYLPELLRLKGELLRGGAGQDPRAAAEAAFAEGLRLAREQGAPFWELRIALSLARLHRDHGRAGEAREMLAAIFSRFAEGHGTADLRAAKQMVDEMAGLPRKPAASGAAPGAAKPRG